MLFEQLPLDIAMEPPATLDNFVAGDNEEALACLKRMFATADPQLVYLWGESGVGKTHLAIAMGLQDDDVPIFNEQRCRYAVDDVDTLTEEGLDRILQTGRIQELPSELYSPLPKAYRVELLRRMIFCIHKGWYFPHLIKPQKFRCPRNLMFFVSDNQHLSCGCLHPVYGSISVTLHEKSIVYSICDFLEFLQETALIDSVEETEAILTQKLKELTES